MPLLAAYPVVYWVGGVAFGSLAAAYAYIKGDELKDSLVDGIDYVTGTEQELTTLEELGLGNNTVSADKEYKTYEFAYPNKDKTLSDIKSQKDAFTNIDTQRSTFVGENVIPADQRIVKLNTADFEQPQVKSQLNDLVVLEKQKKVMIETKEWDKLPVTTKDVYNNQIQVKEKNVANALKQVNTPQIVTGSNTQIKDSPILTQATYPSLTQKDTVAIEQKVPVSAPNIKESKITNQLASSKTVTMADAKSVAVSDTVPI